LVAAGNRRGAAAWLVEEYASDVLGLCVAMVRDRSLAEDLAQDAFSRAFASLDSYRADASASTWLLAVAKNRCLDHLRKAKRDPWAGAPLDDETCDIPDDAPLPLDQLLRRGDVGYALSVLSEGERTLIVLRYRNELDYAELAEVFGLREGTVRMRISRALDRMREALDAGDGAVEGAGFHQALDAGDGAVEGAEELGLPEQYPLERQSAWMNSPAPLGEFVDEVSDALWVRLFEMAGALQGQ
jgi:RNA polymerase sigma-70 factor (ECF subfamily)